MTTPATDEQVEKVREAMKSLADGPPSMMLHRHSSGQWEALEPSYPNDQHGEIVVNLAPSLLSRIASDGERIGELTSELSTLREIVGPKCGCGHYGVEHVYRTAPAGKLQCEHCCGLLCPITPEFSAWAKGREGR